MYVDPTGRILVMALSWNYSVDYCMDCIMAVVAMDRVAMTWRVHVLALEDETLASAWSRRVPVPGRDDTSDHRNWELAIVHHCWFLHYWNMDPRWNCLGYQNILVGMSEAARMIASESWHDKSLDNLRCAAFRFGEAICYPLNLVQARLLMRAFFIFFFFVGNWLLMLRAL